MRFLVATASKYGATHEIGSAITETLAGAGDEATALQLDDSDTDIRIDDYDAVIVGSAVYAGHWIGHAKKFVQAHADELRTRPVWLFSSGPIGDPPKPAEDPVDAAELIEASLPREHRVFAGSLEGSKLRFADRAVAAALRAPEGDYRDFDAIRSWANQIASSDFGARP